MSDEVAFSVIRGDVQQLRERLVRNNLEQKHAGKGRATLNNASRSTERKTNLRTR